MRIQVVAASAGVTLLLSLAGRGAGAQTIHVIRPAHGAIVRETVPVRVAPSDMPADGYVSITIDGQFVIAQTLPKSPDAPVYTWDTKGNALTGTGTVKDGDHTIKIELYTATSKLLGSDTVPVRVANQIPPPAPALKLTYHWPTQSRLVYHRISQMKVPSTQPGATTTAGEVPGMTGAAPDQVLQDSDLEFVRSTEGASDARALLRDIIVSGTLTDRGLTQPILKSYNIEPRRRTVSARGEVLSSESNDDLMDHIGFPVPELPARRVGKGDSWLEPVVIALNWDGSSQASVTAECRLEDFEWQNNYPTAKIRETYSGPVQFSSRPATASGHTPPPPIHSASVTYSRVVFFAYGAGRMIKELTDTQVTLTPTQLALLGGSVPGVGGGYAGIGGGYNGAPGGFAPGSISNDDYTGGAAPRLMADTGVLRDVQFGGTAAPATSVTLDVSTTTTLNMP